jgi:phosphomannomutase
MEKIKFGTDGWRAIIAKEFTVTNVVRVTEGVVQWLQFKQPPHAVVVGYDCRFGGKLFAETVAGVLAHHGIKVILSNSFVSTPMVSLATKKFKASLGIIITASHNPPDYNGYKLKGSYGGPLLPEQVSEIENLIPNEPSIDYASVKNKHLIHPTDLETLYIKHIEKNFDLASIKKSKMNLAYDAMFGAGQNVIRKLLPDVLALHCENNPSFQGIAPEPIAKNLTEASALIQSLYKKPKGRIHSTLATDGDADRIGLFGIAGNFIDSHHIILLLIHYLCKYKKMKGKVVVAFSVTPRIKKICDHYGLELQVVQIGFKYICGIMITEDVLLGGEESGGIAIKGHLPERDGIWMGLTLWEFMAKSKKTMEELIKEVYKITGSFAFERNDLHLTEEVKNKIVANCQQNRYTQFGNYRVQRTEDIDGWKYHFGKDEWLMIRASGTEPVLRTYAESSSQKKAFDILQAAKKVLLK